MFGFICNTIGGAAFIALGSPVLGSLMIVGGLVYLIPLGDDE